MKLRRRFEQTAGAVNRCTQLPGVRSRRRRLRQPFGGARQNTGAAVEVRRRGIDQQFTSRFHLLLRNYPGFGKGAHSYPAPAVASASEIMARLVASGSDLYCPARYCAARAVTLLARSEPKVANARERLPRALESSTRSPPVFPAELPTRAAPSRSARCVSCDRPVSAVEPVRLPSIFICDMPSLATGHIGATGAEV